MADQKSWSGADRNLLTATAVKNAKLGRHRDGAGLFLEVDKHGKRWIFRVQHNGKRHEFGLGTAVADKRENPAGVTLAEARLKRDEYVRRLQAGKNPAQEKRAAEQPLLSLPTFAQVAQEVYEHRQKAWSNGKHQAQWISSLRLYAFPAIGGLPVDKVDTAAVLKVLTPIWHTKRETASRVRQRISAVLDWAKAHKLRTGDNPCELIDEALGKQKGEAEHFDALPFDQVGQFIRDLRAGKAAEVTKIAFEIMILTAVRTSEIRSAQWSEVDLAAKLWTIPAERMKARKPHVAPLSDRVVELFREAEKLCGERQGLVFRDPGTARPLSENRFLNAREGIGYRDRCTPHGFRSSFRDWASETTNFPSDVVEMALAHSIKSKVERAYRRGDLLEKRRALMDAWAAYVTAERAENVVPIEARRAG